MRASERACVRAVERSSGRACKRACEQASEWARVRACVRVRLCAHARSCAHTLETCVEAQRWLLVLGARLSGREVFGVEVDGTDGGMARLHAQRVDNAFVRLQGHRDVRLLMRSRAGVHEEAQVCQPKVEREREREREILGNNVLIGAFSLGRPAPTTLHRLDQGGAHTEARWTTCLFE